MNFNKLKYLYSSIAKAIDPFFGQKIENKPDFTILSIFLQFHQKCKKLQLSLRDSNRLDEVRCSLTFDRSRFLNSPGLFTQMHIILHESVLSGHILLNKIFRFSLIFQTRLQKVDKIFRVL